MKKITLLFCLVLFSSFSFAQLALEGFEGASFPPAGWVVMDNGVGTVNSWTRTDAVTTPPTVFEGTWSAFMTRENIGLGNTSEDWLVTPQITVPTNGQLRFFARSTIAGNQGTSYQIRVSTNPSQMVQGNYIIIQSYTEDELSEVYNIYEEKVVSLAAFQGQEIYVAFVMQFTQPTTALGGDRWLLDNVEIVEQCIDPTNLTATGITQTSAVLGWNNPGGATQFEVEVVQLPDAPTGTGVLTTSNPVNTTDLGLTLTENTQYQFYVRAICSASNSLWVGPFNFATQSPGETCEAPIQVTTLPYTTTDNTSNYGNNYNGSPGTGCGSTSGYLGGDDVFYAYTAPSNGVIQITMTPTATWSGLFVYNSCANVGVSCVAGVANSGTTPRVIELPVTAGVTYYIAISTFPSPQSTGYTLTIQQVNCPPPSSLTVNNITGISANIAWANPADAISWEYVVQNAGAGIPAGSGITTTSNTINNITQTIAGIDLTPATQYEYYVRVDCNDGNFSAWAGPFVFLTTQIPASLNYFEDFEGVHGWSLNNGTQVNKWVVGNAVNNGGTQSLYISNNDGVSNAYTITTSSVVHAFRDIQLPASVDEVSLSFDWRAQAEVCCDYIRVWVVPTTFAPTPGTLITAAASGGQQFGGNFNNQTGFVTQNFTINAAPFAGQIVRLVFEWRNDTSAGTQPPGAVDNINLSLITCPAPSGLAISNLTEDTASFSWNTPSSITPTFDYILSTSSASPAPDAVPTGNTSETSVTINDLSPSTNYYFWVRSNCDTDGTSFWIGPVSFNTPQVPASMNFFDDFEGPNQWVLSNGTQVNKWVVGNAVNNGGAQSLYISNNDGVSNTYTITTTSVVHAYRDIQMPAAVDEISLSFDWRAQAEVCCDYIRAWIVPVTFTPTPGALITAGASGGQQFGGNLNNQANFVTQNFVIPAAAYSGQVVRLIFEWRNDGSVGTQPPGAIDNVNLSLITCPAPSGLAISNLTEDSATFTWTGPSSVTPTYDYILSTSSASPAPDAVPTGNTSNNSVILNDFLPSTTYYFWVRSNCDANGTSFWVGPITFNTPQIPAQLNFIDDFEGSNQWILSNGTQPNQWIVGSAVSNGGVQSLYITNNNGVSNSYTINVASTVHAYRDLQIPEGVGELTLSFDWRNVGENGFDYVRVWFVPVTFTPTPGTLITVASSGGIQLGGNLSGQANWVNQVFSIPAAPFAGQIRRLIFEWRNDTSIGTQPPGAIDNVNLSVVTCPRPDNLNVGNITQEGATLTWNETGTATQWEVIVLPAGSPAPGPETTGTIVSTNSFPIGDLTSGTPFVFYVRAICGENDLSLWAGPRQFATLITNDECANAISVPVNSDTSCGQIVSGTIIGATASSQPNACVGTADDDVWFQFVATAETHFISLTNVAGSTTDLVHAVYTGDNCGSLSQISCSDPNQSVLNNLVPGQTYYIRVYTWTATPNQTTTFNVCVGTPVVCSSADAFCSDTGVTFNNTVGAPSLGQIGCLFTTPNPAWFFLQIDTPGDLNLLITQTGLNGQGLDVDYVAWGPFPDLNTACLSIPANPLPDGDPPGGTALHGCSYSAAPIEYMYLPNTQAGDVYVVLITNFSNQPGTITFSQQGGSAQTDCSIVCPEVSLPSDIVVCDGSETVISANTTVEPDFYQWFKDGELLSFTSQEITVNESGVYTVVVGKEGCENTEASIQVDYFDIIVDQLSDISVCESFVLPVLLNGNYFTEPNGAGIQLNSGDVINSTQTIYIYNESNTEPNCFAESSFTVNIGELIINPIDDVVACNVFILPNLVLGNYFTEPNGEGIQLQAGDEITVNQMVYVFAEDGVCTDEINFNISIFSITVDQLPDVEICESYTLPELGENNLYYTGPNASGVNLLAGETITQSQIIYIFAQTQSEPFCTDESQFSITIIEPFTPELDFSYTTPVCSNDEVNPTPIVSAEFTTGGVFSSTEGLIINPETGEIDLASDPGTYEVTYTYTLEEDECGESGSFTTIISILPAGLIVTDFTYDTPICLLGDNPLPIPAENFSPGGLFSISGGLTINPATGEIDLEGASAGDYIVTYTIPSSDCTEETSSDFTITLTEIITPELGFTYASPVCSNASENPEPITISGFAFGGVFSSTEGLEIDPETGVIDLASIPGTYTITYTYNPDVSTCESPGETTATITITPAAVIVTDFTYPTPVCASSGPITPTGAEGFTTGGVFSSASADLSIDPTTGSIDVVNSATGTYEVTYEVGATECTEVQQSTFTVTINALSTPQLGFSYTTPVCSSDANPAPIFSEGFAQGGSFSSSTATVDPQTGVVDLTTPAGEHVITYTLAQNNDACTAAGSSTATIVINAAFTPETGFVYAPEYCFGDQNDVPALAADFFPGGTFTATGGLTINAQTGEITLLGAAPGSYTVTYTVAPDTATCNLGGSGSFSFTVSAAIEVALEGECDGAAYFLTASPVSGSYNPEQATYVWRDADGNQVGSNSPTFNVSTYVANNPVLLPSSFSVTVTYNGCEGTQSFVVESVSCIIQRGISPNNDGDNDFFDLRGYNVRNLSIFNRYGRKVYSRASYSDQWKGQSDKGDELPDGTYFYVIDFADSESITGWIYINREQ